MLSKLEKSFTLIFLVIVSLELIANSVSSLSNLHYISKPAIVLALIVFFNKQKSHLNAFTKNFTILALVFSLLGDILLMFVNSSPYFFISGLIAFLVAHIMYVLVFLKKRNPLKKPFMFIVVLLMYASGLFYILHDGLGNLLIPVIIYISVILSMATTAFIRQGKVADTSYWLVFIGAIFFMLSDSILATNKFYKPLAFSGISIMFTYAIAQYLIVLGILRQKH